MTSASSSIVAANSTNRTRTSRDSKTRAHYKKAG